MYGCRSRQNWWAKSCKLREDTQFASVRVQLTLGTELLPLATGQSFIEGVMFITQCCSEFLVLCSEFGFFFLKKKGCCCVYFVLALVLCWLGTNLLFSAKCSLHRATHLYLLLNLFTVLFQTWGGSLLWFCTALHSFSPHKVSESHFLIPHIQIWKILSE